MPKKYSKNKRSKCGGKTRKQKMYVMKGCSRKKRVSSLGKKQRGGSGCGSGGCPIAPFSWKQMNMRGGMQVGDGRQMGGKYHYPPNNVLKMQTILPQDKYPLGASGQIGGMQMGGSCGGTCGLQPPVQMGGGFYKPAAPIPGPFVGKPWGTSLSKWPAISGISGDRNYLKNYKNVLNNDPQLQQLTADVDAGYKTWSSMVGGYKYNTNSSSKSLKSRSSSRARRGGGLIPQDLVNLGQDATYNLKSAYNTLNGYSKPVSPLPYQGQLTGSMDYNKLLL